MPNTIYTMKIIIADFLLIIFSMVLSINNFLDSISRELLYSNPSCFYSTHFDYLLMHVRLNSGALSHACITMHVSYKTDNNTRVMQHTCYETRITMHASFDT